MVRPGAFGRFAGVPVGVDAVDAVVDVAVVRRADPRRLPAVDVVDTRAARAVRVGYGLAVGSIVLVVGHPGGTPVAEEDAVGIEAAGAPVVLELVRRHAAQVRSVRAAVAVGAGGAGDAVAAAGAEEGLHVTDVVAHEQVAESVRRHGHLAAGRVDMIGRLAEADQPHVGGPPVVAAGGVGEEDASGVSGVFHRHVERRRRGVVARHEKVLRPQAPPVAGPGRVVTGVVAHVGLQRKTRLLEVVCARGSPRLLPRARQGGQQHGRQDRDDGDHDEQLDQREGLRRSLPCGTHSPPPWSCVFVPD